MDIYNNYINRINDLKKDLAKLIPKSTSQSADIKTSLSNNEIYHALKNISSSLSNSYQQVISDLNDSERISWAGTAHEIREIVTNMLRLLAPDKKIILENWYKQEPGASGPTQKQRVRFILQQQNAGSKQSEVVVLVTQIEDLIGNMVRATYSRASDAAHRSKDKKEALRLLRYFEAFAHDLLDL